MGRAIKACLLYALLMLALTYAGTRVPVSSKANGTADRKPARAASTLAAMPLVFEQNVGQASAEVEFLSRGAGFALGLSGTETTLSLSAPEASPQNRRERPKETPRKSTAVKTRLIGANPHAKSVGEKRLGAKIDYFLGNDPKKWQTDVPAYERVRTASVYPGIDVIHYGQQSGALEYDFVVAPGADPGDIRLAIEGSEKVAVDVNGDLVVTTPGGELRQQKPVCYQERAGERVPVEGEFVLEPRRLAGDTQLPVAETYSASFRLGEYDTTRPLVIDPVLVYSTFLGGADGDVARSIAVDSRGLAYVTGEAISTDFPTTAGRVHDNRGGIDAFVAVLDPARSGAASLIYSTYLGGQNNDEGYGIAVDGNGRAFVTGNTESGDFPTTAGRLQGDARYGDAFVTVLDPAKNGANSLLYSTYLGGNDVDYARGIAVDASGQASIAGITYSPDFPTTAGRFQVYAGNYDAFLAVLDPTLNGASGLVYSTYLGSRGIDSADGIAVNENGKVYVTGWTDSQFPTTTGRFQDHQDGSDAFLAVVDPAQSGAASLVYSTCLGGAADDASHWIAVDENGRAYIAGDTTSSDFPTTGGRYQGWSGDRDVFVSVLDPAQSGAASLVYSTFLGGPDYLDVARGIAADGSGRACVAWSVFTRNGIVWGSMAAVIDPTRSGSESLVSSTALEKGNASGIAVDSDGRLYVTGSTGSPDFPTTFGRYQGWSGSTDAFVTVLDPEHNLAAPTDLGIVQLDAPDGTTKLRLEWTDNSTNEDGFSIERRSGAANFAEVRQVVSNVESYIDTGLQPGTSYQYRVRAFAALGTSAYTNTAAASTLAVAPTNLGLLVASSTLIKVSWTDNSANENGFWLERSEDGGATWPRTRSVHAGTGVGSTITVSEYPLIPDTLYTYRVRAFNNVAFSAYEGPVSATTQAVPAAPSALTVVSTSTSVIKLSWRDNADNEWGFKLERSEDDGATWSARKTVHAGTGVGSTIYFWDSGLSPGTNHSYRVRAYNGGAHSAYAGPVTAGTQAVPAAPSALTVVSASTTVIKLSWRDNADNEWGFKLERSEDGGATWSARKTIHASTGVGSTIYFWDSGLIPGTNYSYRVRAYNDGAHSAYAGPVTAGTQAVPAPPSALTVISASTSVIKLSWRDNADNEWGFKLERSEDGGATWSARKTVHAGTGVGSTIYFWDSGLIPGTNYSYRVRAYNDGAHSAYAGPVSAMAK